jgi:hypothetical protein
VIEDVAKTVEPMAAKNANPRCLWVARSNH